MLPFDFRVQCWDDHFYRLRFDQAKFVQPLEFFTCIGTDWDEAVAYLAADCVSVRPIESREEGLAAFVREYRARYPEKAARLRFDGPSE